MRAENGVRTIQETVAWTGTNRFGKPFRLLLAHQQIQVLSEEFGHQHLHRNKSVAAATLRARNYIAKQFVNDLRASRFELRNLLNLDQRHIGAVVRSWETQGLSAPTIQGRMSVLRWLATALGKRGLVNDPTFYGVAPETVARRYVAEADKSWRAKQVIAKEKIEEARTHDKWVAAQLHLISAFGLRVREAIMIKPRAADHGTQLRVEDGTKGGRTRLVPIRTNDQRQALEAAKEISMATARGNMCQPGKTVAQAIRRLYYIADEKLGISKEQLGVTPHGLRHEYANDRYEEVSGHPSAVRGGQTILDRAADERARHAVTSDLGHARLSITAAYTGPRLQGRPRVQEPPKDAGAGKEQA